MRGYFSIGIENGKTEINIGTLWRSADIFNASYIFTVGKRYKKQSSDTMKTWRHTPLFSYADSNEMYKNIPYDCMLVGIEITDKAEPIKGFKHPERAVYVLGAEDHGLTTETIKRCHRIIQLPGDRCMNVSVAGSIVMYDRYTKGEE